MFKAIKNWWYTLAYEEYELTVWFDKETNMVYEYDLHYPVGKVKLDDSGKHVQVETGVYLVEDFIKIPEFKFYE